MAGIEFLLNRGASLRSAAAALGKKFYHSDNGRYIMHLVFK